MYPQDTIILSIHKVYSLSSCLDAVCIVQLELKFCNDISTFDVNVAYDIPLYELNPSPFRLNDSSESVTAYPLVANLTWRTKLGTSTCHRDMQLRLC
jgi:hypothetical protein